MDYSSVLLFLYLYVTFMFGYYYYSEQMRRLWTPRDYSNNLPVPAAAFLCSLATCWWYWPLMAIYTYQRVESAKESKLEAFRKSVNK